MTVSHEVYFSSLFSYLIVIIIARESHDPGYLSCIFQSIQSIHKPCQNKDCSRAIDISMFQLTIVTGLVIQ